MRLSDSETRRVQMLTAFAVVMFGFGVTVIEVWKTEFPLWAFVLALTIGESSNTSHVFHT